MNSKVEVFMPPEIEQSFGALTKKISRSKRRYGSEGSGVGLRTPRITPWRVGGLRVAGAA
jgi:hypothetical protein